MHLATFEFEGVTENILAVDNDADVSRYSSSAPHAVSGRFTLDLDALNNPDNGGSFSPAVVDFTVTVGFEGGPASAQYSPVRTYSGSTDGGNIRIDLGPHPKEILAVDLSGPWAPLPVVPPVDPFAPFPTGVMFAAMQRISLTTFDEAGLLATGDLSVANLLALINEDMRFRISGDAGGSSLNDLFVDPHIHNFSAEGTITSLTEVGTVPLPAAAWLMLSGLAALAGVRAWPRGR